MRTSSSIACMCFVALAVSAASAQQVVEQTTQTIQIAPSAGVNIQMPGMPGSPRQFKTGTGRIRGRVLASDGTGPVRRAQVRLSGGEAAPRAALTDAEGRFEFRELRRGGFCLTPRNSGFVKVQ